MVVLLPGEGAAGGAAAETMLPMTKRAELRKSQQIGGPRRQLLLKRCWPWLLSSGTLIPRFNRCCVTDQPLDSAIELVYVRTSLSLAFFLSYGVEQAGMSYQEQQEVLQNNLGREVKLD